MSNSIYGGILYPNSSFHIDKVYSSFKEANDNAATDNVLLGRYVLIAYTERALEQWERVFAESQLKPQNNAAGEQEPISTNILRVTQNQEDIEQYQEMLKKDNSNLSNIVHYDRHICRKDYNSTKGFFYSDIANLSTSIDLNSPENNAFLNAFKNIVQQFDNIDDALDADLLDAAYLAKLFTDDINAPQDYKSNLIPKDAIREQDFKQTNTNFYVPWVNPDNPKDIWVYPVERNNNQGILDLAIKWFNTLDTSIKEAVGENKDGTGGANKTLQDSIKEVMGEDKTGTVSGVNKTLQDTITEAEKIDKQLEETMVEAAGTNKDGSGGVNQILQTSIGNASTTNSDLSGVIERAEEVAAGLRADMAAAKLVWGTF